MGSHPWWSHTPYKEPLQSALDELRHKEFLTNVVPKERTGEYKSNEDIENGIAEYIEECDADGTCSILDVSSILDAKGEFDYGGACGLTDDMLMKIFGTTTPASKLLHDTDVYGVYELLDRGLACYVVGYDGDNIAKDLHFFGMSYD